MADEKIYVGNAKKINTQFGELTKLSLTAEDVEKLQQNLDNGWVNVVVKERREPSPGGMTHYLEVDTWKPNTDQSRDSGTSQAAPKAPSNQAVPPQEELQPEDLPF